MYLQQCKNKNNFDHYVLVFEQIVFINFHLFPPQPQPFWLYSPPPPPPVPSMTEQWYLQFTKSIKNTPCSAVKNINTFVYPLKVTVCYLV